MLASEGPLGNLFHTLGYMQMKIQVRLRKKKPPGSLARAVKAYFDHDMPQTLQKFTDRLKEVAMEYAYQQPAIFDMGLSSNAFSPSLGANGIFPDPVVDAMAMNALANSQQQLVNSSGKSLMIPNFAALNAPIYCLESKCHC